ITARKCKHLHIRAVYAHLSSSDTDCQANAEQIREFKQVVKLAREIFGHQLEISLFASHGLIRFAKSFPTNWVRPGILLYGEHNFATALMDAKNLATVQQFRPTIRLRARITQVLQFVRREKVGYGQHHETRPGQRLATVAVGFGSGYP